MKHLKEFENEADVKVFVKPNVVLANDTGKVLYNVEPVKGVFIQHIDGKLYTTAQWAESGISNDLANGVAVCGEEASFVISLVKYNDAMWASDTTTLIEGVTTTEDSAIAKTDYNGKKNTDAILKVSTSGAAYLCANYTFPNGQRGYLPALGEYMVVKRYEGDIERAFEQLGTYFQPVGYGHSSTQAEATRNWSYGFAMGGVVAGLKTNGIYAIPFTTLQ